MTKRRRLRRRFLTGVRASVNCVLGTAKPSWAGMGVRDESGVWRFSSAMKRTGSSTGFNHTGGVSVDVVVVVVRRRLPVVGEDDDGCVFLVMLYQEPGANRAGGTPA